MKIISVVGARPNFMKIAPFCRAIESFNSKTNKRINHILVHTGQHYDDRMSNTFFDTLNIPKADINLNIGSGSHAEQVGNTMISFEKILIKENPDWVVVVGDVNATLACSVTAKKLKIKVCHIEAGLRSRDLGMPEEINRLVTDRLSDLLLTPDELSANNLRAEGVSEKNISYVGNIMIDTLEAHIDQAKQLNVLHVVQDNLHENDFYRSKNIVFQEPERYVVLTMHRPSNVDDCKVLEPIVKFLTEEVAKDLTLIWPIHPRAEKQLGTFDLLEKVIQTPNLILLKPLGYHDMLRLNMGAQVMLTDSGGLQEECCVLGTPCLTMRWNTERPITLREHGGASVLVGNDVDKLRAEYLNALSLDRMPFRPGFWDGNAASRCLEAILNY